MKIIATRIVAAVFPLIAGIACTTHKVEVQPVVTEHEVKPIHITLDVNLKVANEIKREFIEDNSGAANAQDAQGAAKGEIRARRRARREAITDLKKRGVVGEHSNGLLVYRVRGNEQAETVKAENADREKWYQIIADENGMLPQDVAAERARASLIFSPAGSYVMKDGAWYQVTPEDEEKGRAERQIMRDELRKQRAAAETP
ncbi:MAG: DUF1318 domain-containing protein [Lentisphaeria bacterium]|nr:DUF1318 domain-containing protein [Lentisphaeria bacterium]